MDTKIVYIKLMIVCFTISITTYGQAGAKPILLKANKTVAKQQQMLKDYFLCSCIDYGFKDDSLFFKDHTLTVYTEMLDYNYNDIQRIDHLAEKIASEIPMSNYSGKRGIFGNCMDYYRSRKLDKLIKSFKIQ